MKKLSMLADGKTVVTMLDQFSVTGLDIIGKQFFNEAKFLFNY